MSLTARQSDDRPWLKSYPPGVPATIDPDQYRNLVDLLDTSFGNFADRDAAVFMEQAFKFSEVDVQSQAFGAWLQSKGLAPGARVAIMMPNVPQYMVAIAAILRAGFVVVNVNPLYTPRELLHQLKDSGAEAIVILENFAHTLEEVIDDSPIRHVVLATMGDMLPATKRFVVNLVVRHVRKLVPSFKLPIDARHSVTGYRDVIRNGQGMSLRKAQPASTDVAFLQYTGGTTGVSKGATLTHRNVVANILQSEAWFSTTMARVDEAQLTMVCALPLYHIFALTVCYLMGARIGGRNILIPNPRDIPGLIGTLSKHRVHMFPAVNTLYNSLANHPDFSKIDFSGLVVSNGGGMAVQEATAAKWLKLTGCPIAEGYGLSETSPVATANRLDLHQYTGTIGFPVPSTDIRIRDDDGCDVPMGESGEICIRGPQVMVGYWQRPDDTAQVMTSDGFFKSGDVGIMNADGSVRIVDRKKDMILVSGFNVFPNEIEQVVCMHPGVLECAAVGIKDDHSGEAVKLFVVKKDPALSEEDLGRYCRDNFTGYKRPKIIEFRLELPKSTVGKILRRELRT